MTIDFHTSTLDGALTHIDYIQKRWPASHLLTINSAKSSTMVQLLIAAADSYDILKYLQDAESVYNPSQLLHPL